jgi:hypothetical protein
VRHHQFDHHDTYFAKELPMKKKTFRPTADQLETRVVLSGTPKFIHGAAVLTTHALGQTYSQIQTAFAQYMNHGQNFKRLEVSLAKAVSRIPYNRRDGLFAAVEAEALQMRTDIRTRVSQPVKSALQRALNDVHDFVQSEVGDGVIVVR